MVNSEPTDFSPVETMDLSGGHLCLDFTNTASARSVGPFREKLRGYTDLVTWAERVDLVDERGGERLRKAAIAAPRDAEAVLDRARKLREAIYRIFVEETADPADLELISTEAGLGAVQRRLVGASDGYAFEWPESESLEQLLWPIAVSAAELLVSPERERVKECDADDCNWLFLDMSRNQSRRWCDMRVCGNRAKARRFSERHRSG